MADPPDTGSVLDAAFDQLSLHPIAPLVPADDPRRRILENLDKIAQGALRNMRGGVNKNGYEFSYSAPDWNAALKCQVAAAALLNPKLLGANAPQTENPVLAAIERAAERMIREGEKIDVKGSGKMDS